MDVSWNSGSVRRPVAQHVNEALLDTVQTMHGAADFEDGVPFSESWPLARQEGWKLCGELHALLAAELGGIPASVFDDKVGI